MDKITEYFAEASRLLHLVSTTQHEPIRQAAEAVAKTLGAGGMVFAFGTGHSHMLAEELFYRAGGLVKVYPILDEPLMLHTNASRSSHMERLSGYAATLLEDGCDPQSGDVLFLFSNSGRNTVPVDMAVEAKKRGVTVICITNLNHSRSVASRHPSGQKLYEVCDIVRGDRRRGHRRRRAGVRPHLHGGGSGDPAIHRLRCGAAYTKRRSQAGGVLQQ